MLHHRMELSARVLKIQECRIQLRDRKYEIILDRYLHREFAMRSSTRLAEDAEDPEHRSLTEKEGSSAAIDTLADRWCKVSSKGACG